MMPGWNNYLIQTVQNYTVKTLELFRVLMIVLPVFYSHDSFSSVVYLYVEKVYQSKGNVIVVKPILNILIHIAK